MQFKLTLDVISDNSVLPISYNYPLSSIIYRILSAIDNDYGSFLHSTGYRKKDSLKSFKFFTFSDLRTPFKVAGDRLQLQSKKAELVVSFHLPEASEHFIRGLFMNQKIEVADKKSKVDFMVSHIQILERVQIGEGLQELLLQPISPMVSGIKNERNNYDFLPPDDKKFTVQLLRNWKEKYRTVYGEERLEEAFKGAEISVVFYNNPPKSRLIAIKAGTPEETKIRGFVNFRLKIKGQQAALALLINSGVGIYNSLGMGCVGVEKGVSSGI